MSQNLKWFWTQVIIFVANMTPTITATYYDLYSDVNTSGVTLELDGSDVTVNATINSTFLTYDTTYNLSRGAHNVTIEVKDTVGHTRTLDWRFVANLPPTHDNPILNATTPNNNSLDNLTIWNQSTFDGNGDAVKNIYNWYLNGTSLTVLNMPFEGYYGNETTMARDYSGFENDATLTDVVWKSTNGIDGFGAVIFDGNPERYVNITNHKSLNFDLDKGGFTVEVIFKSIDNTGTEYLLTKGNPAGLLSSYFIFRGPDGKLIYKLRNGTAQSLFAGTHDVNDTKWHHVAMRVNPSSNDFRAFLDGKLDGSTNLNLGGVVGASGDLIIGAHPAQVKAWNGTIDDVRIWNRTLSVPQIKSLLKDNPHIMVTNEIEVSDYWNGSVTPNDGLEDGETKWTNWLKVEN